MPAHKTSIRGEAARPPSRRRRCAGAVQAIVGGIALLCAIGASAATPPEMVFAHLGSDEGLSQGTIMAIVQDAQGFLWFGTEDGLDRFDGYEIRHFIHERNDADTLPNSWIAALGCDTTGRLWVGSDGGGLVYRIGKDRKGLVIYDAPKREVTALAESADGRLYVAAVGEKTKSPLPPLPARST